MHRYYENEGLGLNCYGNWASLPHMYIANLLFVYARWKFLNITLAYSHELIVLASWMLEDNNNIKVNYIVTNYW